MDSSSSAPRASALHACSDEWTDLYYGSLLANEDALLADTDAPQEDAPIVAVFCAVPDRVEDRIGWGPELYRGVPE